MDAAEAQYSTDNAIKLLGSFDFVSPFASEWAGSAQDDMGLTPSS